MKKQYAQSKLDQESSDEALKARMTTFMLKVFFKPLKPEEVHFWEYRTIEDVQNRIPYFIDDVYNHKKLHSAIGYLPPDEYTYLED